MSHITNTLFEDHDEKFSSVPRGVQEDLSSDEDEMLEVADSKQAEDDNDRSEDKDTMGALLNPLGGVSRSRLQMKYT